MKKLSMAMAAVMMFVSCMSFTASAANTMTVAVSTATPTVEEGGNLTISVDFSENTTGFNTLGVTLTYPEGFTYVADSAAASDLIVERCYLEFGGYEGETYVFNHDAEARTLTFVGASLYNIGGNTDVDENGAVLNASGTIFTADFTADAAGSGEFTVAIVDEAYDEAGAVVGVDEVNGTVTVESGMTFELGDINMDEFIDLFDAIAVLQYEAGVGNDLTDAQLILGDVNKDDFVDLFDAIAILQYEAGVIESFD